MITHDFFFLCTDYAFFSRNIRRNIPFRNFGLSTTRIFILIPSSASQQHYTCSNKHCSQDYKHPLGRKYTGNHNTETEKYKYKSRRTFSVPFIFHVYSPFTMNVHYIIRREHVNGETKTKRNNPRSFPLRIQDRGLLLFNLCI